MGIGAWETLPSPVIVVGIPNVGIVFTEWAIKLKGLNLTPVAHIISSRGYPIQEARNGLVLQARQLKADYLFFLDSDVICPPNTIFMLLGHNLPIVSGIYKNKNDRFPAAWRANPSLTPRGYAPIPQYEGVIMDVDVIGMGCCLINMKVFDVIAQPWFEWTLTIDQKKGISEDFDFCEKARKAGFRIKIDTRVQCDHLMLAKIPASQSIKSDLTSCEL